MNNIKTPKQIIEECLTLAIFNRNFLKRLVRCVPIRNFKLLTVGRDSNNFIYEIIAKVCYIYFEETGEEPANYFNTLIEPELPKDKDEKETYLKFIHKLFKLREEQDTFNQEFILKSIRSRTQARLLNKFAKEIDENANKLEIKKARNKLLTTYRQLGEGEEVQVLDLVKDSLDFSDEFDSYDQVLSFDLPIIDAKITRGIQRGELVTVLAGPKVGKTWFLTHLGEVGMWYGKKVLHITCELKKKDTYKRYIQSAAMLSDFPTGREISYRRFDELGNVEDTIAIDVDTVRNTKAVNQARELLARGGGSIKMEYMSSASISDVHTLIALLEAEQDWKPDILIVDYVEMMYLDPRMQRRDAIFETYKGLRDIADEYNLACITASQPNRINMDRRIRSGTALAEDIRKAAVSDMIVAISPLERDTRDFYILYNRAGEGEFGCEFSVCYTIGQVAMQSWPIRRQEGVRNDNENISS